MKQHIHIMEDRLRKAVADDFLRTKGIEDFIHTFTHLGVPEEKAIVMALNFFVTNKLRTTPDIHKFEKEYYEENIALTEVNGKKLPEIIAEKFADRASKIVSQIEKYFGGMNTVLDYGCGDGEVIRLLHEKFNFKNAFAFDVIDYVNPEVEAAGIVKIISADGTLPDMDGPTDIVVVTNVIHHSLDAEKIRAQIKRLQPKLIVIVETVPVGNTAEELAVSAERTFINDYLYNRILHYGANVPTPGTYKTTQEWVDYFVDRKEYLLYDSEHLGIDQTTIRDHHALIALARA